MSKFESMSDFEINKLVAEAQGLNGGDKDFFIGHTNMVPDYCNSWADMGPLLVEWQISLTNFIMYWRASSILNTPIGRCVDDKNPLRAAAIIYLESLESNDG